MSTVTPTQTLTLGGQVSVRYPASGQYGNVVLSNLSPYLCQVVVSGDLFWLAPWTAQVYNLQHNTQNPVTVTPSLVPGTTVPAGAAATLTGTWYDDGEPIQGTYPLSLTANAIAAAIAGVVQTVTPASLLTNGTLPVTAPGATQSVNLITPSSNALALEIAADWRWCYSLTGDQTGTVYARAIPGTITPPGSPTQPEYVIIDINPAVDTTYTLLFQWEGTGNSPAASPYWVTQRTNEYKQAVTGGADFNTAAPVPVRNSVPNLLVSTYNSAVAGTVAAIPAVGGPGILGLQYHPRIWAISMDCVAAVTAFILQDSAGPIYFAVNSGKNLSVAPMGLLLPTTTLINWTAIGAGQCFGSVFYDYAPAA